MHPKSQRHWGDQTANSKLLPGLVVLVQVSQGILKAFNFLLPRIKCCCQNQASDSKSPIDYHGTLTHWLVCILPEMWQCLGSGQIALHVEAAGRLLLQFLIRRGWIWHHLATESQHFEKPLWWPMVAINEIQQKALARDSRRETANDSASLCKGLRGYPNKGVVKTLEMPVMPFLIYA